MRRAQVGGGQSATGGHVQVGEDTPPKVGTLPPALFDLRAGITASEGGGSPCPMPSQELFP